MSAPSSSPKFKILQCAPEFFEVIYEINPWMNKNIQPEDIVAKSQWGALNKALESCGAIIESVKGVKGLPDMVYTANAGLARGKKAILSRFKFKERQGEEPYFHKWFEEQGYSVHTMKTGYYEGEGDSLFAGENLVYGYGFRSELKAADEVQKVIDAKDVIPCELVDPYFYHLDTAVCPLTKELAFFHKTAVTKESLKRLEKYFELFAVPEKEAKKFVCNAVVLGHDVVLPAECSETEIWLKSKGYTPHAVKLDQFLRGGGSAKCLTLILR